jgi:hypothetical protein
VCVFVCVCVCVCVCVYVCVCVCVCVMLVCHCRENMEREREREREREKMQRLFQERWVVVEEEGRCSNARHGTLTYSVQAAREASPPSTLLHWAADRSWTMTTPTAGHRVGKQSARRGARVN